MAHRRGPLRQLAAWTLLLLLATGMGLVVREAFRQPDTVAVAESMRAGDAEQEVLPDPRGCIELLDQFLLVHPGDYSALLVRARAWADLSAWDNAILDLEQAANRADELVDQIIARSRKIAYLLLDDRFDDAVDVGMELVALQPGSPARLLQVGTTHYKGSVFAQKNVRRRFRVVTTDERTLERNQTIEAYITNVWREPDVDEVVHELVPNADPHTFEEIRSGLLEARRHFQAAAELLAGARDFAGFEPTSARAHAQLLLRSGRVYEAYLAAAIALRETRLPFSVRRDLLLVQAGCSLELEDYASAARTYDLLIQQHEQRGVPRPLPYVRSQHEARVQAGQFAWILQHVEDELREHGDDAVLLYARAAALQQTGRSAEALAGIRSLFTTVSMGARSLWPPSFRADPMRRRRFLELAYHLFEEAGDPTAAVALDAILTEFPRDAAMRRLRIERDLSSSGDDLQRLVGTENDAFLLLTADRRDRADLEQWLSVADRLSVLRQGDGLQPTARLAVARADAWRRRALEAEQDARRKGRRQPRAKQPQVRLFWADNPALTYHVVLELIERGNLERARVEMRKLVDAHPQVQEFRFRLALVLVREGRLEAASVEFRRILEDAPSDAETLDLAMRADYALGRTAEANELVQRMILSDPLGVGAVRFGNSLLQRGKPRQALRLVERLTRWTGLSTRRETLILVARSHMALEDQEAAQTTLRSLIALYPSSVDVALLALDVGIAQDLPAMVGTAIDALRPLVADLLPDQMQQVPQKLVDAGLHQEALSLFDEEVRSQPAAAASLRPLIHAAVATGRLDEANLMLESLDASEAVLDQFLLLSLRGDLDLASRQLRRRAAQAEEDPVLALCLLASSALQGYDALSDAEPMARLTEHGLDSWLEQPELELFDAVLRLRSLLVRPQDVRPAEVVSSPTTVYPAAGADVARLLELAALDRRAAARVMDGLVFLFLARDRPPWREAATFLAEWVLVQAPGLTLPALRLARAELAAQRPDQAVEWLRPLLAGDAVDVRVLELFLEATQRMGHAERGMALAVSQARRPEVALLVAETLDQRGYAAEAVHYFESHLQHDPSSARSLGGLIAALSGSGQHVRAVWRILEGRERHPDDPQLALVSGRALGAVPRPDPDAVRVMDELYGRFEELHVVGEARIRAHEQDPERLREALETYVARMEAAPMQREEDDPSAFRLQVQLLWRAAQTAARNELPALARQLHRLGLRLDPGSAIHLRKLAFLELDEGQLEVARQYLEVLSFIDLDDREAAMALARLYFSRLGRPVEAARVVERTIRGNPPPDAVEILAARAFLLGHPERAIEEFRRIERNPLVTVATYMTIARIAYASQQDELAAALVTAVLAKTKGRRGHPERPRAEFLRSRLEPAPARP